jgi:hypothetical protein
MVKIPYNDYFNTRGGLDPYSIDNVLGYYGVNFSYRHNLINKSKQYGPIRRHSEDPLEQIYPIWWSCKKIGCPSMEFTFNKEGSWVYPECRVCGWGPYYTVPEYTLLKNELRKALDSIGLKSASRFVSFKYYDKDTRKGWTGIIYSRKHKDWIWFPVTSVNRIVKNVLEAYKPDGNPEVISQESMWEREKNYMKLSQNTEREL